MLKSEPHHLYHIYWSLWRQLSWKKSLLVVCKILRLFVNTYTAYGKYSLFNRHKLVKHLQMQLSQKEKTFSPFSFAFWKSTFIFKNSKRKMALIADVFLNLRTPKNVVRYTSKKSLFRGSFAMLHGKPADTLSKSKR